ncbi:unnamed protein product [Phytophthora lilii]|uniref:Unnamed protein product n=1 Tax=Phytophthora lilii TaxID=2077276 RepID=A0A9W6X4Q5_9STRA|nr:unnamed protein product [Phytophthora lilii]
MSLRAVGDENWLHSRGSFRIRVEMISFQPRDVVVWVKPEVWRKLKLVGVRSHDIRDAVRTDEASTQFPFTVGCRGGSCQPTSCACCSTGCYGSCTIEWHTAYDRNRPQDLFTQGDEVLHDTKHLDLARVARAVGTMQSATNLSWYPRSAWNGDMPIDECTLKLYANSVSGKRSSQLSW